MTRIPARDQRTVMRAKERAMVRGKPGRRRRIRRQRDRRAQPRLEM